MMPTREAIIITEELIKGVQRARGFDGRRRSVQHFFLMNGGRHTLVLARGGGGPDAPFKSICQNKTSRHFPKRNLHIWAHFTPRCIYTATPAPRA